MVSVTVGEGGDADTQRGDDRHDRRRARPKTVTIPLTEQPPTGQNVPIKVEVKPVPGEKKTDNNTQTLP